MSFAASDLTHDDFLGGLIRIWQPKTGYRAATDPVYLAAAIDAAPGQSVLELGCGVGVAIACLCQRVNGLDAHGLEVQPDYAELARQNSDGNSLGFKVHTGDLLDIPVELKNMSFDHVFANPPFYDANKASAPQDKGRDTAHREGEADLADWIEVGLRRVGPKGYFTIIHRVERLPEILSAMHSRAGDIRILPIASRQGREAGRVIVRCRKNSSAKTRLLAPMIVHQGNEHSDEGRQFCGDVENILRNAQPIVL